MSSPYELLAGLALLRERKRLADTSNDKNLESWSALLVRVGEETCILRQDDVDEIIAPSKLNKVRGVESWVLGLSFFRGKLLTVLDLSQIFNIVTPNRRPGEMTTRIMVVGGDGEWFGLKVDELLGIRHVWSDSMDSMEVSGDMNSPWTGYVERWIKIENNTVPILQIKQLVLGLEQTGRLENKN